ILVEDARIAFGGEDIGVGQYLVRYDRRTEVGIMVFDERDRVERRDSRQSGMVEIGHVEPPGIGAHRLEDEAQRKVESGGPPAHALLIEHPLIDENAIAVEELADGELARHRFPGEERKQE